MDRVRNAVIAAHVSKCVVEVVSLNTVRHSSVTTTVQLLIAMSVSEAMTISDTTKCLCNEKYRIGLVDQPPKRDVTNGPNEGNNHPHKIASGFPDKIMEGKC